MRPGAYILRSIAGVVVRRPRSVLLVMLALTIGAGWLIVTRLKVNFSTAVLFVSGDPRALAYEQFLERFGNDDTTIYLAVEVGQTFSRERLTRLRDWCARIEQLPRVEAVFAPCQPLGGALGIDPEAVGDADLAALERFVRGPAFRRLLLSDDGRTAGLVIQKRPRALHEAPTSTLVPSLWALIDEMGAAGCPAYMTGIPVLEKEYVEHIKTDQARFLPLMIALCLTLLIALFRTWRVIFALAAIVASVAWAGATLALCGVALGITNHIITVLVLVVGTADAIHLLARFEEEHRRLGDPTAAARASIEHVGAACFLTTFTTGAGFFSLVVIDNPGMRDLALFTPPALMATFVVCVIAIPAMLALFPPPAPAPVRAGTVAWVDGLEAVSRRAPRAVVGLTLLVVAAACVGITRVEFRSNWLAMLADDNRLSRANRAFEASMAGIIPVELTIDGGAPGAFAEPARLAALGRYAETLAADPVVGARTVLSAAAIVAELNAASPLLLRRLGPRLAAGGSEGSSAPVLQPTWLPELASERRRVPPQPGLLAALLAAPALADGVRAPPLFARYLDAERRRARVTLLLRDSGPEQLRALERQARSHFAQAGLGEQAALDVGGVGMLVGLAIDRLANQMLTSLVFVFAMVALTLVVLFRRPAIGLISLLPNVLPVLVSMGLMPLLGLYLNFSIAVVFSIGVGIAVDDTIHFLARYLEVLPESADQDAALRETMRGAGQAIWYTSILLVAGFSVLFTSSFKTAQTFATLGLLISLLAALGDLFTLPALLRVTGYAPMLGEARDVSGGRPGTSA